MIRATLAALAIAGAAGPAIAASAPDQAVTIDVRARAIAPGEPLRIVVDVPAPLESASATFLGRAVHLAREPAGVGERWTGWTVIDLDRRPGLESIEFRGRAADGRAALGTRAVSIEPREFPTEELSVQPGYVEPPADVRSRIERERERLQRIYAVRSPPVAAGRAFERPVPGQATSIFGTRRVFNGRARDPHPGLDLRAPTGTPVRAAGPGRVALAEELYYSGNTVLLDHGGGLFTIYGHLSELSVGEGRIVAGGEQIGRSGSTGRVTGPHLHWGAKIGDRPFDPTALLDPALFAGADPRPDAATDHPG